MTKVHPIVLLTDFGLKDNYAASMKGVILSIFPRAVIVDLSHDVEPQNITQAAFLLGATYPYFPRNSIFVNVVDPGVGSERNILAARTKSGIFLAPDNGLLAGVLQKEKNFELRRVTRKKFFRKTVSRTFHGRDCFAPAAAHLARNPALFSALGPRLEHFHPLDLPVPRFHSKGVKGEVVFFDHFGNAFTNIPLPGGSLKGRVTAAQKNLGKILKAYYQVPKGEPLALISSTGWLEIAVNQGSAERVLKLKKGSSVEIGFE